MAKVFKPQFVGGFYGFVDSGYEHCFYRRYISGSAECIAQCHRTGLAKIVIIQAIAADSTTVCTRIPRQRILRIVED
jgi:hypothetical protein